MLGQHDATNVDDHLHADDENEALTGRLGCPRPYPPRPARGWRGTAGGEGLPDRLSRTAFSKESKRPVSIKPREDPRMKAKRSSKNVPPDGLPTYRLLTGPDDAAFCRRVSEALALGYKLYGSPAATYNGKDVMVAQAVIWPSVERAIATPKG